MTFHWSVCLTLSLLIITLRFEVYGTIDVNLNELEYLAARLNPFECRRLIAVLHYTTYDLPKSIAAAERNVDEEIPCIRQLIHWNGSPAEGKGKTHEAIVHRLRQINRGDLADWLGKSAFKHLGIDLNRAIERPFGDLGADETESSYPITINPIGTYDEEDAWSQVDTVLIAIVLGLLGTLITLICASILYRLQEKFNKSKNRMTKEQESKHETQIMDEKAGKKGKSAMSRVATK